MLTQRSRYALRAMLFLAEQPVGGGPVPMTRIAGQANVPRKFLELILADDASDDGSVAIARAMAEGDARVRVIASGRNQGPAATRNLALDAARGDWIAVVDSDDEDPRPRKSKLVKGVRPPTPETAEEDLADEVEEERACHTTYICPVMLIRRVQEYWKVACAPETRNPSSRRTSKS